MKVAVIGCGNSGCAHAAKLVENGHEVNLIKTSFSIHDKSFDAISKTKEIVCIDSTKGDQKSIAKLSKVTRNIEEGLSDVDAVMILTQSLQHRDLAPRIVPFLKNNQIVFLIPGNMGSIVFDNCVEKDKHVVFVEGESTPYDARLIEPGVVNILFKNARNAVSFLYKDDERYLENVNELFGSHRFLRSSVVESTMHNPNLVVHTIGSIMSASRIELAKGEFWMYRESFSDSIWNIIHQLDNEKNSIIKAFGGKESSYLDQCKWRNKEDLSIDSLEAFKSYADKGGPKGPDSLDTRYIYEDVPMELGMLELLGKHVGVATPVTSSLITIASVLKKKDYREVTYKYELIKEHLERIRKENS